MPKLDQKNFQKRVKRINNPRNKSYYDPELGMHIPKRVPRDQIKKNKAPQEESFLAPFLVSMILGGLGLMIGQAIRFRYFEITQTSDLSFALDLLSAAWVVAILSAALQRYGVLARFGQLAGVAAMSVAGHNLIWRWPEEMGILYTRAYVDQVLAATEPQTIVLTGSVFGF